MASIILVLILSLSITFGGYLGIELNGRYERFMTIILAFTSGVMFHASAFDMFFEALESHEYLKAVICFILVIYKN